ncbi:Flp family type IVb pilin [Candidatus Liberibacter africanus]|nr:Flp family type IVb pilin [Candidatus Liberibacter africanus]QTP63857.1 Flp family type IVb pilin [Candidatus Liberibacter africanus]
MINVVQKFLKDEKGVGAIEYGLLASLIAVVIITSVTTLGTNLTGVFKNIAAKLSDSSKN